MVPCPQYRGFHGGLKAQARAGAQGGVVLDLVQELSLGFGQEA